MFSSYILIALENLKRQPGFASVKVLSLAIGLFCSILILLHVQYATSFDKHIPNWENTYRLVASLTTDRRIDTDLTSDLYAAQMKLDYPQIEHIARMAPERGIFARGEKSYREDFHWAEPDIIPIFSLEFISGDPATALNEPNTVVLSATAANKYFPGEEALGQKLTLDNKAELLVTGIMRDLPDNTHLNLQVLVSLGTGRQLYGAGFMTGNNWTGFGFTMTYLTLPNTTEARNISNDLANFVVRNVPENQRTSVTNRALVLALQPLADIYLDARQGFGDGNNRQQVLVGLGIFSLLILLTCCINFANLSLSQIKQRSMEIGIRKTLGAKRTQIVLQFLFEAMLLTFLALLPALAAVYLSIPVYANLTGTGFTSSAIFQSGFSLQLLLIVVATGIIAGLLPALVLARFEPANIMQGPGLARSLRGLPSVITIIQFGCSTALLLFALAINLQIRHLQTMEVGFNKDNLVVLDTYYSAQDPAAFNYEAMRHELQQHPGIIAVGENFAQLPDYAGYNPWRLPSFAPDEIRSAVQDIVDVGYFDAMQLTLLAGRWFSADFATDFSAAEGPPPTDPTAPVPGIVITHTTAKDFGFATPEAALNQLFLTNRDRFTYRVIGVVEDYFIKGGIGDETSSTNILRASSDPLRYLMIRIDPVQMQSALAHIDRAWEVYRPKMPLTRAFYSQTYNDLVGTETNGINNAAMFASIITILISIMGLYAVAFYATLRRTREIGIRKVAGASSAKIVSLLSWDFLKPVLVACALACVAGYFAIDTYFQQFSSRAEISPLLYVVVTIGTLLVAILTVATQCYRAANADPVKSLRYE